jgi:PIN domain nuclease of toxin-antitoxin system
MSAVRLLLDTHALLWWLAGDDALSSAARRAIETGGDAVFVSAASAWEIATKYRIGKLPGAASIVADIAAVVAGQGFAALPVSVLHGQRAGALPSLHRDPFDRMLVAQALIERMDIVSNEQIFDGYGVSRVW